MNPWQFLVWSFLRGCTKTNKGYFEMEIIQSVFRVLEEKCGAGCQHITYSCIWLQLSIFNVFIQECQTTKLQLFSTSNAYFVPRLKSLRSQGMCLMERILAAQWLQADWTLRSFLSKLVRAAKSQSATGWDLLRRCCKRPRNQSIDNPRLQKTLPKREESFKGVTFVPVHWYAAYERIILLHRI